MRAPFALALLVFAVSASGQPVRPGVDVPGRVEAVDARLELTVLDAETGAPLPGATAQVQGEEGGASAGADGQLALDLPFVPATVVVRFVGYASAQLGIEADDVEGGVVRKTVRLSPAPFVLGEVTVSGEPPGEILWRRLLARREFLSDRLGAYAAEGYGRFLLLRDGVTDVRPVPIRLEETLSNLSWSRLRGLQEEVVARHRTPPGGPFNWARMGPLPDLYFEDVLWLDGRAIPSPTAPNALRNYAFRLGETVDADGFRYLDLAVIPRRNGLVSGRIRVVDTLLVIAEADLRFVPGRLAGPVDDFDASYRWSYESAWAGETLGDSLWLPRRFDREGRVTVNLPGYRVPTVRFRQMTVLDLVVPGARGEATRLGRRYRSPRAVYEGRNVYRAARNALPLDSLEVAADESPRLRRVSIADMLPRQEGLAIATPLTAITNALGIGGVKLEGDDDP
ncbi:MAG: carboxypeptidase-like regulatory domain-containing protein [Bacteroidota bacterium]